MASAAYRARDKLYDDRIGKTHDYRHKDGLSHAEILLPDHAPKWMGDRQQLWAAVEKSETRINSQVAREFILALPHELTDQENITLTRDFAKAEFIRRGMIADVCIHDLGSKNPHAHILLTMRHVDENGLKDEKKSARDWNKVEVLKEQRAAWSQHINQALEQARLQQRVDHRSWKEKNINHTPQIHLGWYAHKLEQKGIETERGNYNRTVQELNKTREEIADLQRMQNDYRRQQQTKIEQIAQQKPTLKPHRQNRTPESIQAYQHQPKSPPEQQKNLLKQLLDQQRDRERIEPGAGKEKSDPAPGNHDLQQQLENLKNAITEFSASVEKLKETEHIPKPPAQKQPYDKEHDCYNQERER